MESIWELLVPNSIENWSPAQLRALCMHCQLCTLVTDPSQGSGSEPSVLSCWPLCLQLFSLPPPFYRYFFYSQCKKGGIASTQLYFEGGLVWKYNSCLSSARSFPSQSPTRHSTLEKALFQTPQTDGRIQKKSSWCVCHSKCLICAVREPALLEWIYIQFYETEPI